MGLLPASPAATRVSVGVAADEEPEAVGLFLLQLFDVAGVDEGRGSPVEDGAELAGEEGEL